MDTNEEFDFERTFNAEEYLYFYQSVLNADRLQREMDFLIKYNALKPKGIFCFDSHNRDTFMTYYLPSSVVEREGNFMIDQRTFDPLSGRCVTKRTVIYKQSTKSFQHRVRFYVSP